MQAGGANATAELTGPPVAAPIEAAWESIRTGLRRDLGARTFDGWLKPAQLGTFDGESGELEIIMPSQFMADWVHSHFGDRLALACGRRFRSYVMFVLSLWRMGRSRRPC